MARDLTRPRNPATMLLIWCKGKTGRNNGKKMTIEEFIKLMEQNGA